MSTKYTIEAGNTFGQAILGLIQEGIESGEYTDTDEAIFAIAELTGNELSDEDIVEMIESEELAVDSELFDAVASAFNEVIEDENVYNGLLLTAMEANGEVDLDEVFEAIAEQDEDDEDEDEEEDEYVPALQAVEYARSGRRTANFSAANVANSNKVNELEDRIANFEAYDEVKDKLSRLTYEADAGVAEGWLPPVARNSIVGNFSRENDMIAEFSKSAVANDVDLATQLFGMEYALEIFKRVGANFLDFSHQSEMSVDPEEIAYEQALDKIARGSIKSMGLVSR